MRRALFGGTFDPPHVAHLAAGEAAYRQLGVEQVTFLPAGDPWQKRDRRVSAATHRWEMTRLAVDGVDYFEADRGEIDRQGPSYTVDTLARYPADDELVLVLGADAALGIGTWERSQDVLGRVTVAVAPRTGVGRAAVEGAVGERMVWLDLPELAVSGTELRRRVRAGGSIRFLVREAVWGYIQTHRLYGADFEA